MARLTKYLHIAIAPEIKTLLERAAASEGRSLSNWIRMTLTQEARKVLKLAK